MSNALVFIAVVEKVQTLADGGIRVTLDLSETAIPEMAALAACRQQGLVLRFEATEHEQAEPDKPRRASTADWLEAKVTG